MNLSLTELIIASSGNSILAFNSFHRRWTLSSAACQANAFGMTYLGEVFIIQLFCSIHVLFRHSVYCDPVCVGPAEIHDGDQGQAVSLVLPHVHPIHPHLHLDIFILSLLPANNRIWHLWSEQFGSQVTVQKTQLMRIQTRMMQLCCKVDGYGGGP